MKKIIIGALVLIAAGIPLYLFEIPNDTESDLIRSVDNAYGFKFSPTDDWYLHEGNSAVWDYDNATDGLVGVWNKKEVHIGLWNPEYSRWLFFTDLDVDFKSRELDKIEEEVDNLGFLYEANSVVFFVRDKYMEYGMEDNRPGIPKSLPIIVNANKFEMKIITPGPTHHRVIVEIPIESDRHLYIVRSFEDADWTPEESVGWMEKFLVGLEIR